MSDDMPKCELAPRSQDAVVLGIEGRSSSWTCHACVQVDFCVVRRLAQMVTRHQSVAVGFFPWQFMEERGILC